MLGLLKEVWRLRRNRDQRLGQLMVNLMRGETTDMRLEDIERALWGIEDAASKVERAIKAHVEVSIRRSSAAAALTIIRLRLARLGGSGTAVALGWSRTRVPIGPSAVGPSRGHEDP
ncbi:hypothetical protein [Candidatus Solirubrobacter pratensis]|uniref:hypothetical protein n=1 Tax=Candidatus Solirubrobacter pratensis TaxID=1298857 RepID=UPI00040D7DE4|nr:hypothetical protein [Candidatus Solirubrobacter pratensis]